MNDERGGLSEEVVGALGVPKSSGRGDRGRGGLSKESVKGSGILGTFGRGTGGRYRHPKELIRAAGETAWSGRSDEGRGGPSGEPGRGPGTSPPISSAPVGAWGYVSGEGWKTKPSESKRLKEEDKTIRAKSPRAEERAEDKWLTAYAKKGRGLAGGIREAAISESPQGDASPKKEGMKVLKKGPFLLKSGGAGGSGSPKKEESKISEKGETLPKTELLTKTEEFSKPGASPKKKEPLPTVWEEDYTRKTRGAGGNASPKKEGMRILKKGEPLLKPGHTERNASPTKEASKILGKGEISPKGELSTKMEESSRTEASPKKQEAFANWGGSQAEGPIPEGVRRALMNKGRTIKKDGGSPRGKPASPKKGEALEIKKPSKAEESSERIALPPQGSDSPKKKPGSAKGDEKLQRVGKPLITLVEKGDSPTGSAEKEGGLPQLEKPLKTGKSSGKKLDSQGLQALLMGKRRDSEEGK